MDFIEKFIDFIISLVAKIKDLVSGVQGIVNDESRFDAPTEPTTAEETAE